MTTPAKVRESTDNSISPQETFAAKKAENVGYFSRFLQNITAPVEAKAKPLEDKNIKPINGSWPGLLYELAQFLLVDKAGMTRVAENDSLFINMSTIVEQVLKTIGAVNWDANLPAELNDPDFIKHLVANLLNILFIHDFKSFDLEAGPYTEKGIELRTKLNKIFNELMLSAGLDQEHVADKPPLVQYLLYPNVLLRFGLGILSYAKGLPSLNRAGFENIFAETVIEALKLQRKLEAKSQDDILNQNEGLLEIIDSFVKTKILKKLRSGDLPLTFTFLKSKKNSTFLSSMINKVMAEQVQNGADDVMINEAWKAIENQLKMAIQAIFAVLLTKRPGQSPAERRDALIIGVLDRLGDHTEGLNKRVLNIKKMKNADLVQALTDVKGAYGERAANLLKENREKLEWEIRARELLKKLEYVQAAQSILKNELNPQKFADYIPKIFKVEDLFQSLYEFIGETALELHTHQQLLEQLGDQALSFIKHSPIAKLPAFVEDVMAVIVATLEENGEKNEIDLGYGKFVNDILCSLLKKPDEIVLDASEESYDEITDESEDLDEVVHGQGKIFAKEQVLALAKNILMIVIKKAIDRNTTDECHQEEAFSNLINHFVKSALEGLGSISEKCNAMKDKPTAEKIAEVRQLVTKLGIKKFIVKNTDEELIAKYRELHVQSLSRDLISYLMTEELFNSLLPPMFRKSGLWEWVVDGMMAPYLEGISAKLDSFSVAEFQIDSSEAKQLKLTGDCLQLRLLIKPLTAKASELISNVKFSKLLKTDGKKNKFNKVNFEILDDLFGKSFQQGGQIKQLIELVFPKFIESILAFHLNAKDGKSSQERATDLLWLVLEITHDCYHKIDAVTGQELNLEVLKNEFSQSEELKGKNFTANVEAYCTEKKIKVNAVDILKDPNFYIWLKMGQEMNVGLQKLMDLVIPKNLWDVYVPKEFDQLIDRNRIGQLLLGYLKEGYAHSANMKKLVSEGKIHLEKEELNKEIKEDSGLQRFIEKKVVSGLKDATKNDANDEESIKWVRGVVKHLLDKENESPTKPLTQIAINGAYAVFGKLLTGGLSSLDKAPGLANVANNDLSLVGKIAKLIPEIRDDYYKLNELQVEQKCSELPQITVGNIKNYLSLGNGHLKEHENLEKIPEKFETKDNIIVFRVSINNDKPKNDDKPNMPREVFVDVTRFIYWQVGHQALNELIPDDDWKELVPALMQPLLTKEVLAEFAVPYIHAARQIQEPLERKSNAGKLVIKEISKEDPDGNLEKLIEENLFDNIRTILNDIANDPARLDNSLPEVLDNLFKDLLKTQANVNILNLRNALVERVCYLLLNEWVRPGEKRGENGAKAPATARSVAHIIPKFSEVIKTYETSGKNPAAIAQKILDEFIPEATWNEIFTGKFNDLVNRKIVVTQLEKKIKEICGRVEVLTHKQAEAMIEIQLLDQQAQLEDGRSGGLEKALESICKSIDDTMDEYAFKEGKILEGQPLLINELAKGALKDPTISNVIKSSSHAMVSICLARVFKAEEGQPPEERLLEVLSKLIKAYNADHPKEAAIAWLQELLPEDLRKEILPPFLHNILTHAFIAGIVLEKYVPEVTTAVQSLSKPPKDEDKKSISKLQDFVKSIVANHNDPEHSKDGILGLGGFVKPLETVIAVAATGKLKEENNFEGVSQTLEKFIDGTVTHALTMPQMQNLLNNQFLTEALIESLPSFKGGTEEFQLPNFEMQCGKLASEIPYANGAADLPLPKVLQSTAFKQIQDIAAGQMGRFVKRNERILTAIEFFGVNPAAIKDFESMQEQLKIAGHLNGKEKMAERLFKAGLLSFVMQKIEQNIPKNWPNPFRWLAVQLTKAIVKLALRLAINQQIWNFVSDAKNDSKFRLFVWKFLNFAKTYDAKLKNEEELRPRLTKEFADTFNSIGLFKGIQSKVASMASGFFKDQNFVSLIVK